jgi:signal peptidase I
MLDETNAGSKKATTVESIANTFEWIITALILALTFRAFILEAFQIPTGSMADTLMGDHFRICCTQCGYKYEYNFNPLLYRRYGAATKTGLYKLTPSPKCPSCGYYENSNTLVPKSKGDRILVFKCLYQFAEPKRWDVIVFKNPTNPKENYIKRLIGKPGETVEIIDGDIYINGVLARKPEQVQKEQWMCVYDNDYQPIRPMERDRRFNNHFWGQPFTNDTASQWKYEPSRPTEFTLNRPPDSINTMFYDIRKGNDFRAVYAYGDPQSYHNIPFCSDLMMKYWATFKEHGTIGIGLSKYESLYKAYLDSAGKMIIEKTDAAGVTSKLARREIPPPVQGKPFLVRFTNVDHKLTFEIDKEKLTCDLGTGKDDAGRRASDIEPRAMIFGSGNLTLNHVALYRDIHYLDTVPGLRQAIQRAGENNPFTLGKDEFFAMGDNSPDSFDSRLWTIEGFGNNRTTYRPGIVPRDYLVGKAFFVYWPGGLRINETGIALIPNLGRMRFIYGGRD